MYDGNRPEAATEPMRRPTSVVLLIGDGCGWNHHKAQAYFAGGAYPPQYWSRFEVRLAASTFPENGSYDPIAAWSEADYPPINPTDSAAAATALACGTKTANGMIGMASDGHTVESIVERAEAAGMLTGIVTSVPISHATPAAFAAHASSRGDYGDIARSMVLESGLDVLAGCGNPDYDNNGQPKLFPEYDYIPKDLWDSLQAGTAANDRNGDGTADPWTLVTDPAAWLAERCGNHPAREFAHALIVPRVHDTLQQRRSGDAKAAAFAVPFTPDVPRLADVTRLACDLLSSSSTGFFLMVEGGAIDWASHAGQSGRMIEETGEFVATVEAVLAWVDADPSRSDTLVIVTADHETGYLLGPDSGDGVFYAIGNTGAGNMPNMEWNSGGHSNSLVPFLARGANARHFAADIAGFDSRRGWYVDNATIGRRLLAMLSLPRT